MIKIVTKSDLDGLEALQLPKIMKEYLRDYHAVMLKRFNCENDSLRDLGCVLALDSREAVEKSGLKDFLKKYPPSRIVGLTLHDDKTPILVTQILLFAKGGYAVSIFALEHHVKGILKDLLKGKDGENA